MNDIDILEEFINNYKKVQEIYKDDEIQAEIERSCYFEEVPYQAISNLIAENKKLKEENKCLKNKELDYMTVYLTGTYDERDKWKNKIKKKTEKLKTLAEKSENEEELYIRKNQIYLLDNILQEILDERNNTDEH